MIDWLQWVAFFGPFVAFLLLDAVVGFTLREVCVVGTAAVLGVGCLLTTQL